MPADSKGGFLIGQVHRAGNRVFNRLLRERELDINSAQGRILFVLWEHDAISIRELAERSGLKKSTLTSMLDRLEDRGLVERRPSTDDRRLILIHRTDADRALQARYDEVSKSMTGLYYRGFSDDEVVLFESMLDHIRENLEAAENENQ